MSQEENKPNLGTASGGGANLTSNLKFLRKTRFRRPSASHSETEYIPGLSNPPDSMDVDTDNQGSSVAQSPMVVEQSGGQEEDKATDSDVAMLEATKTDPSAPRSPSPKLEATSPTIRSLPSRAPSPPESTMPRAADSIASSPRSASPDVEIKVPNAVDEPGPDFKPFSPEELDQAKTLVLDLLGWGVDPEYLVTSGVSPEIIFRIFTDLNLHLPKNLKVSEELKAVAYSWGPPPDFTQSVD